MSEMGSWEGSRRAAPTGPGLLRAGWGMGLDGPRCPWLSKPVFMAIAITEPDWPSPRTLLLSGAFRKHAEAFPLITLNLQVSGDS